MNPQDMKAGAILDAHTLKALGYENAVIEDDKCMVYGSPFSPSTSWSDFGFLIEYHPDFAAGFVVMENSEKDGGLLILANHEKTGGVGHGPDYKTAYCRAVVNGAMRAPICVP